MRPGAAWRGLAVAWLGAGCLGPWREEWNLRAGDSGGGGPATDSAAPEPLVVSGSILTDTVWTADRPVVLEGVVWVEGAAVLTLQPGVVVEGRPGSALIVTQRAQLYARGTPEAPIVFTAAQRPRSAGSWGGVVLLGDAPVVGGTGRIEGVDPYDSRALYGGDLLVGSCGLLEYVRIEFAGFEAFADNELNGLTLGGCGRGTIVRYVQVHQTLDDGVEMFGGNVDLSYVLVSGPGDDGIDWDDGWVGRGQFLAVQMDGRGENGIEADGNLDDEPRSAPTLSNVTLVGADDPTLAQRGLLLREGTAGLLRNLVVTGFRFEGFDLRDAETVAQAEAGTLELAAVNAWRLGPEFDGVAPVEPPGSKDDDDAGFDEFLWFTGQPGQQLGQDPLLGDPWNLTQPDLVPAVGSPVEEGALTPLDDGFFNPVATFRGAFRPGAAAWTDGWTAFPSE